MIWIPACREESRSLMDSLLLTAPGQILPTRYSVSPGGRLFMSTCWPQRMTAQVLFSFTEQYQDHAPHRQASFRYNWIPSGEFPCPEPIHQGCKHLNRELEILIIGVSQRASRRGRAMEIVISGDFRRNQRLPGQRLGNECTGRRCVQRS